MIVKDLFNPVIKIVLFIVIMFLVAKWVPYGGFVSAITERFDFEGAQRFTAAIEGEPNPEAWEAVSDYFSLLINTLISIPLLSAVITTYRIFTINMAITTAAYMLIVRLIKKEKLNYDNSRINDLR